MYTAIIEGVDVVRYFDYCLSDVIKLSKIRLYAKFGRKERNDLRLEIYSNGGGGAFPFGNFGRCIYDRVPRALRNKERRAV